MSKDICVIGGAGFIGNHVIKKLVARGDYVNVVDALDTQVHGTPAYADLVKWESSNKVMLIHSMSGQLESYDRYDVVIHLGAKVGVGQSMYQISEYVRANTMDTAIFLQKLSEKPPQRLVVASSMSIYGEGETIPRRSGIHGEGEIVDWNHPLPTPETKPPDLRSIYALTKYDQEQLCLIWGRAYDVPTVALRFFNTYGPGQSLNNPYTGVMAIFASRLMNNKPPVIYEDGQQSRDFIHVDDVANAVVHAATTDMPSGAYNVGTGVATTVLDVAMKMSHRLTRDIEPQVTGEHRKGDIRHCFADISKIKATGWEPRIYFSRGIADYCEWLKTQPIPADKFEQAHQELVTHGLTK